MAGIPRSGLLKIFYSFLVKFVKQVEEFREAVGRGKAPWIKYVTKNKQICCSFLPKSILVRTPIFGDRVVLERKNSIIWSAYSLESGKIYNLTSRRCECESFTFRRECRHLKSLQEHSAIAERLTEEEVKKSKLKTTNDGRLSRLDLDSSKSGAKEYIEEFKLIRLNKGWEIKYEVRNCLDRTIGWIDSDGDDLVAKNVNGGKKTSSNLNSCYEFLASSF